METNRSYDTASEAVNDLVRRGYTSDFNLNHDVNFLICNQTSTSLSPEDFEIDETYRFEGDTDPADETIVFAISSKNNDIKGIVVNAYGIYADAAASKIVRYLNNHINNK